MYGDEPDAKEGQPLVDACEVFHVAGEAVECLDDDDVELALVRVGEHPHDLVAANEGCPGPGLVGVGGDDLVAFAGSVGATEVNLVFGGLFVLEVCGVSGVDGSAEQFRHHAASPMIVVIK
ncbi:hypothetical protein L0C21_11545 [Sphingosinicellaceae bacterium A1X5R2]|nr:hypothetical protein [Pedomonas mirosovicensis]MCH8685879.1 hypothetical protein [Pedomonas mirosovicensis]